MRKAKWSVTTAPLTTHRIRSVADIHGIKSPLHQDDEAAKAEGHPGIYAPDILITGEVFRALSQWTEGYRISDIEELKFGRTAYAGTVLETTCEMKGGSESNSGSPQSDTLRISFKMKAQSNATIVEGIAVLQRAAMTA